MGRPTRRQIKEGKAYEHVDRMSNTLHVNDTFRAPLLEFMINEPGRGHRHVVVDHDGVIELYDYLDRWLLRYPPKGQ